jgi:hypothetical protein
LVSLCGVLAVMQASRFGRFPFDGGCDAADAHVGPIVVISPEPCSYLVLRLLDGVKDKLAQPFTANCAIVALDTGVLLRLSGLGVYL